MNASRERILGRLSAALHRTEPSQDVTAEFQALLRRRPAGDTLRAVGNSTATFLDRATATGATATVLSSWNEIPALVRQQNTRCLHVTLSNQEVLQKLDWTGVTLSDDFRRGETFGVVTAGLAAAETGCLCIHSHEVPSGLLFLVEALLVVIPSDGIHDRYEDIWRRARYCQNSTGSYPRAVHLVAGPSRTADVEQVIQVGAHGPRKLHLAVVSQDG